MPKITTIVPLFMNDYVKDETFNFVHQEDLLELLFVKVWKMGNGLDSHKVDPNFHRYSLKGDTLMVESFGGKYSHEIGVIDDTRNLNLPKWVLANETDFKKC